MISKFTQLIEADCNQVLENEVHHLKPLQNQHLLITGGTGFLGTWVAELISFLNRNHGFNTKLTLLSRNANAILSKPTYLGTQPNVHLMSKDIRALVDIESDVNYIIHAAASPDNREHATNPLRVIDTILNGTSNILEKSTLLGGVNKILNISSGLVYGSQPPDLSAIPENYVGSVDSNQINSIYAESKRMGEAICSAYRTQHRLPIVTARPFAFIGPYQLLDKPWAVNNFIRDALSGGPIRILGNSETLRSYMYGSEMAFWILRILISGQSGHCYNIGSPEPISLNDLARKVSQHFFPAPAVQSRSQNDGDTHVSKFIPDISLARKELGLRVKIDFETALQKTIEWNKILKQ